MRAEADAAVHWYHCRGGFSYSASSSKASHCCWKGLMTCPVLRVQSRNMLPVVISNHCFSQRSELTHHPHFRIDSFFQVKSKPCLNKIECKILPSQLKVQNVQQNDYLMWKMAPQSAKSLLCVFVWNILMLYCSCAGGAKPNPAFMPNPVQHCTEQGHYFQWKVQLCLPRQLYKVPRFCFLSLQPKLN